MSEVKKTEWNDKYFHDQVNQFFYRFSFDGIEYCIIVATI